MERKIKRILAILFILFILVLTADPAVVPRRAHPSSYGNSDLHALHGGMMKVTLGTIRIKKEKM